MMIRYTKQFSLWVAFVALTYVIMGCASTPPAQPMVVSLVVDGQERAYPETEPITVDQFLREAEVELGQLDRVNPPPVTQISDGMRIEVVRVREQEECEDSEIPYQEVTLLYEGLQPGEQREGQAGRNGVVQICYRVEIVNDQPSERVETTRTITSNPQDHIVYVGPTTELEPVPINGTLAYISNRNAWLIRGSSTTRRPLTSSSDLDQAVFSLSPDGRQLLIARERDASITFSNQLWLITDTNNEALQPVQLTPQDVLYAEWVPGRPNTISYSRAEPRQGPPGWQSLNDLWLTRIDPFTGIEIDIEQILQQDIGGLFGWWGTQYEWSPDGQRLAWVRADSVGLVDFESKTLSPPILEYPLLNPLSDWSWRTTISWSADSSLIATTIHGTPIGTESPETSPVFNIAIASTDSTFSTNILNSAGIWSAPRYSPEFTTPGSEFPKGYLAYLRAREPYESINGDYDLIIADRDGSNARVIFPEEGSPGLTAQQFAQDFTWSPDGRQIAFIYQGNLWIVDVETGVSHQITQDNGASKPVWMR